MAKQKHSQTVNVLICDSNDGVVSDDNVFDWFDLTARADMLKRLDKVVLEGGYFEIKPV